MNARTDFQTLRAANGEPLFVVVPYQDFLALSAGGVAPVAPLRTIPHAVISAEVDGSSAAKAWREHLRLTQAEIAERIGVSQAAYAQMESAKRPRKATLIKIAAAMGLAVEQLE
jgi:DNA-binding XRE family transcriptional regulator